MVYKCRFLKKRVVSDYDPTADETKSWELSDEALAAIWITIKGDFVAADKCWDTLSTLVTSLDVWLGGFNVVHYINTLTAIKMNSNLVNARGMLMGNGVAIDDVMGITFPIVFGAPYLNQKMALPKDYSNRKILSMGLDIANSEFDDLLIDIAEVILPEGKPVGFIKQEEVSQAAQGTGDKDIWLQRNWDLLKILFKVPTVPVDTAWTKTINRAGLEIDDFVFGYQSVPWEILHGEMMNNQGGMAGIENHFHADPSSGDTGFPENLESWERLFAEMDFFHDEDLYWKAPLSKASTAKLKLNLGVDEAFHYAQANYVPASSVLNI